MYLPDSVLFKSNNPSNNKEIRLFVVFQDVNSTLFQHRNYGIHILLS